MATADRLNTSGCEFNPIPFGCLVCPLNICKYDLPAYQVARLHRWFNQDQSILEQLAQGLDISEVAEAAGLTVRTVYRIKQRCKEEELTYPVH